MSKRLPSLKSLRFVEACVRHGNFTRAAAELGVTPTAVSLRIRDLEAELGAELFHRSGPRIAATEAGAALAGRIGEALEQIRLAVEAFRGGDMRCASPARRRSGCAGLRPVWRAITRCRTRSRLRSTSRRSCGRPRISMSPFARGLAGGADSRRPRCLRSKRLPCSAPRFWPGNTCPRRRTWLRCRSCPMTIGRAGSQEAGVAPLALRLYADDYPTHELDAAAAIEGAGVALLSPILFAAQLHEGKLDPAVPARLARSCAALSAVEGRRSAARRVALPRLAGR